MKLEQLVDKEVRIDEKHTLLELTNGFGIACEFDDKGIRYDLILEELYGVNVLGEEETSIRKHISGNAVDLFNEYITAASQMDSFKHKKNIQKIHNEVLSTLNIQPVYTRHIKEYLLRLTALSALTLTYPISAPVLIGAAFFARDRYTGLGLAMTGVCSPVELYTTIKETKTYFEKDPVALQIINQDIFSSTPSKYSVGINDGFSDFNPSYFWERSSDKDYLRPLKIYTKEGYEIHDSWIDTKKEKRGPLNYTNCRYYLDVGSENITRLNQLVQEDEAIRSKWEEFRDTFEPKSLLNYFNK